MSKIDRTYSNAWSLAAKIAWVNGFREIPNETRLIIARQVREIFTQVKETVEKSERKDAFILRMSRALQGRVDVASEDWGELFEHLRFIRWD